MSFYDPNDYENQQDLANGYPVDKYEETGFIKKDRQDIVVVESAAAVRWKECKIICAESDLRFIYEYYLDHSNIRDDSFDQLLQRFTRYDADAFKNIGIDVSLRTIYHLDWRLLIKHADICIRKSGNIISKILSCGFQASFPDYNNCNKYGTILWWQYIKQKTKVQDLENLKISEDSKNIIISHIK